MSNSGLVSYTKLSPNHSGRRKYPITKITPHYMAGDLSVESCGEVFQPTSRQASSNYGIGSDGRVALYVDEGNRAWTSGNADNDNRAVTIECANLADGSLTNACWESLVALCVDVCRRNGIARLNYTGDKGGNLTMHCWFQDTSCPGPWLKANFARLASEVNAKLGSGVAVSAPSAATPKNNRDGGKLDVDGAGGWNTVTDWQHQLGTTEDGVVSGQPYANRVYFPGLVAVDYGSGGSRLVCAMQRAVGAAPDGYWGYETSGRLQEFLIRNGYPCGSCGVDHHAGTDTFKAVQRSLNDGRWVGWRR